MQGIFWMMRNFGVNCKDGRTAQKVGVLCFEMEGKDGKGWRDLKGAHLNKWTPRVVGFRAAKRKLCLSYVLPSNTLSHKLSSLCEWHQNDNLMLLHC
jgi:hypothetical protein